MSAELPALARAMLPSPMPRIGALLAASWLLFTLALAGFSAWSGAQAARVALERRAGELFEGVNLQLRSNSVALQGFAALLRSVDPEAGPLSEDARAFARDALARYPSIYMFEVIERVSRNELPQFLERAAALQPGYAMRTFGYDGDRRFAPVPDKPHYYPITAAIPELREARPVLGLDLDSVPLLRETLSRARYQGGAVSSPPFTLIEGMRGYLLVHPVDAYGLRLAAIVVLAEALAPRLPPEDEGLRVVLRHAREPGAAGMLFEIGAAAADGWWPELTVQRRTADPAQPMLLEVRRVVGPAMVDPRLLGLAGAASLGLLLVMALNMRALRRQEAQRRHAQEQLARMATVDAVTGLPNRNLLRDRLEQALARAQRQNGPVTVLYLDLDGFKAVNDRYGHAAGDELLRQVGQRFREQLRDQDTVARLGGDEFAILVEAVGPEDFAAVIGKLQHCLDSPFCIDGAELEVGVSVGSAAYPGDGTDAAELLAKADAAMYAVKRVRHQSA